MDQFVPAPATPHQLKFSDTAKKKRFIDTAKKKR
jgi:hypothetical protein